METAQAEAENDRKREKRRPEGGTSSKARFLKGKVSHFLRQYMVIRTMCLATLPLPDQRAKHLYAGDSLPLIIKKLN